MTYMTRDEVKAARAANDKAAFEATKVGDVFVSSWGYDQTNVDFYKVVAKTASRVKVVMIGKIRDEMGSGTDYVRPDKTREFGEVMTKTIKASSWRADFDPAKDSYFKVASYANAHRWSGAPKYETAYGWGH
jgi:hypothetical protein